MIKMLTRLRNSIMRPVDAWCMKRCTRSLSATHGDFIYSFVKGKNPAISVLNGYTLQQVIEKNIDMQIEQLYKKRKRYSTTELYQKIFSKLVCVLMAYIVEHIDNEEEMLKVETYSDDYVDNLLKKKLNSINEKWVKKEQ